MNKAYSSVKDLKKGTNVHVVIGRTISDATVVAEALDILAWGLKSEYKHQTLIGGMIPLHLAETPSKGDTHEPTTRPRVALRMSTGGYYVSDDILNDTIFIFDSHEMAKSQVRLNDRSLIKLQKRCDQRMRTQGAREAVRQFGYD